MLKGFNDTGTNDSSPQKLACWQYLPPSLPRLVGRRSGQDLRHYRQPAFKLGVISYEAVKHSTQDQQRK